MRGFLWLLAFIFVALIGAFIAAPGEKADALFHDVQTRWTEDGIAGLGQGAADGSIAGLFAERVRELGAYVEAQIDEELATIDKIQSGEIQVGGPATRQSTPSDKMPTPSDKMNVSTQSPETASAIPAKASPASSPETGTAAKMTAPAAPAPSAAEGAGTAQTPQTEDMFSAIIKQEDRPDQAANTEFWTEERINEALENGEPSSGGKRACLFGCD